MHTPGPWRAGIPSDGLHVTLVETPDGKPVARADFGRDECSANARLMAAAPELLALCKRALAIETSVTQGQERELREGFANDLRAAIAKANDA